MKIFLFLITFSIVSMPLNAAIEIYEFSDPKLTARFQQLTSEIRCPKCQNQNIAGSNSTLSVDLKDIVYEKLKAGESDKEILLFMKERYGEFILFSPEMNQDNLFLWLGPIIFVVFFMGVFFRWYLSNRDIQKQDGEVDD